jgi:DNA polymerase, archaea type
LQTSKIAERYGFRIVHGIIDSIWVQNMEAKIEDYLELVEVIEKETGFRISFEGIYKWIAFLPSKINSNLPVVNRYFGAFQDGEIKVRGIETRRRDTPSLFAKFQNEILEIMSIGSCIKEVRALMPEVFQHLEEYKHMLKDRIIPIEDLVFSKRCSKDFNEYDLNRNTAENNAMVQLSKEGKSLIGGQILRYIITDYEVGRKKKKNKRRPIATPLELIDDKSTYDVKRYNELLVQTCNSVIAPFGYTASNTTS